MDYVAPYRQLPKRVYEGEGGVGGCKGGKEGDTEVDYLHSTKEGVCVCVGGGGGGGGGGEGGDTEVDYVAAHTDAKYDGVCVQ